MSGRRLADVRVDVAETLSLLEGIHVRAMRASTALRSGEVWITLRELKQVTLRGKFDATMTATLLLSTDETAAERLLDQHTPGMMAALSAAGYHVQYAKPISIASGGPQPMLAVEVQFLAAVIEGV